MTHSCELWVAVRRWRRVKTGLTAQRSPLSIRCTAPRRHVPIVLAAVAVICVCAAPILLAPTGARAASFSWSSPTLVNARTSAIPSVSCATVNLCVAVSGGEVYTSRAPMDDQWIAATIDPSAPLVEVSCWAGSQCVAIDADGYVFWTESPYGGAWVRSRHSIDTAAQITGLSCADEGWCVAVDARGSVLTQSQTSPIGAWHTTSYVVNGQPGSYDNLAAVSCTPAACVAANAHGWLWTNKATQGGAWTSFGGVRTGYDISSVSCLTGGLCVVTGSHETTTDPALDPFGGASAWSVHWNSDPATYPQPTAVSCAAATLCVGVNDAPLGAGIAIVSTSPRFPGSFTGPTATDQAIDAPGSGPLDAISCAAGAGDFAGTQVCAVSDDTGHLITGTYPGTTTTGAAAHR